MRRAAIAPLAGLTGRLALSLAALAALAALACTHGHTPGAGTAGDARSPVDVTVENHNYEDVDVAVQAVGGPPQRLGTVTGNASKALRLPARHVAAGQRLQLVAHRVGARASYVSESFTVQPGQHVVWTLENGLTRSSVAIY